MNHIYITRIFVIVLYMLPLAFSKAHASNLLCANDCYSNSSTVSASVRGGVSTKVTHEKCSDWTDKAKGTYNLNCKTFERTLRGKSVHSNYPLPPKTTDLVSERTLLIESKRISRIDIAGTDGISIVCEGLCNNLPDTDFSKVTFPINLPLSNRYLYGQILCKEFELPCLNDDTKSIIEIRKK